MPYYSINGQVIEAANPEEARAKAGLLARTSAPQRPQEVYDPTEGMSTFEKVMAGIGQGMTNVARQIGNIAGFVSDEDLAEARRLDQALLDTGAGKAGSFIGEIAATAPVGGLGAAAARHGLTMAGARVLPKAMGTLAGAGASQGAIEGAVLDEQNRGRGAVLGGVTGAAIPTALKKAGGALIRGVDPSAQAKLLMQEGVDLTPGQMNPRGTFAQMEEAAQSLPVIGPMIANQRQQALGQWSDAVLQRGSAPGSGRIPDLEAAYQSFEPAYDTAKGFPVYPKRMGPPGPDVPLASYPQTQGSFSMAARDRNIMADNQTRKSVDDWLQNQLTSLKSSGKAAGTIQSDDLLKLRSNIRTQIRNYGTGASPDLARVGLLKNAERAVTDALESQLPGDVIDQLKRTDSAYRQYKIIEDAMARTGDQVSGLTPSKLSQAVKAATGKGEYARGAGGELRQLARAGSEAFTQTTPPTGARIAVLGGATAPLAALGLSGAPLAAAASVPALGGAALTLTSTGRKLAGGSTPAQKKAQQISAVLRRKLGRKGRQAASTIPTAAGVTYMSEDYQNAP